jgi:hypothetical protein
MWLCVIVVEGSRQSIRDQLDCCNRCKFLSGNVSHPVLRDKARCISYMCQEDNIYNNRVYRDKCHNNQSLYYKVEVLQNKR